MNNRRGTFPLAIGSVTMAAGGQILLKEGVHLLPKLSFGPSLFWALWHPLIIAGFTLYFLSAVLWLKVLSMAELSLVYPFLALSYVIIILASWLFLGEHLSLGKVLGSILIISGIVVLALGSPGGQKLKKRVEP